MHNLNIDELLEEISKIIKLADIPDREIMDVPKFGIVGRPNAGKTSLMNFFVKDSRSAIVDETAGTTRDFISRHVSIENESIVFIDTPGITKGRKKSRLLDHLIFQRTRKLIKNIHFALFMLDSTLDYSETDQKIAYLIKEAGTGCLIVLNKWDLVVDKSIRLKYWESIFSDKLQMLNWAPFVTVSAKTGLKTDKLKKLLLYLINIYNKSIVKEIPDLKKMWEASFKGAVLKNQGKILKLKDIDIVKGFPVTFEIKARNPKNVHFSLERRIENWLRENFDFTGMPIRIKFVK